MKQPGRMLTEWEIDALMLALFRELWQRGVRWVVFGVLSLGVVGTVGMLGFWLGLRQAGG